ncbi:histidine kinase [Sporomusa acidovorans]|uniref:Histidine kinase n=1 Tax=Sporomusa acidovorans (strain ATCC 49682 / DSM 3132 / Mol) TaxID=1123286 RepID=A0ABZ3IXE0_SPOA4|nr:histidine kinase [Sporomusa acidovorans]OZC22363.1 sensor histidine kinase YpdA [Sporomusa acidovorans DSM 3132]SDE46799.1 Histidine kinase-, DNA gyrase B-, and HSP90-like ATPase [Sporomusa acidovorans]
MSSNVTNKIKETFQVDIVGDQQFDWGEQHWLQLDPGNAELQPTVSVATVYPGAEQLSHMHSGFTEIIIGLEGETTHWCNERKIKLDKGKVGYVREGSQHRIVNTSQQQSSFLSVVYSTIPKPLKEVISSWDIELSEVAKLINLDAIVEKFAQSVQMTVTLIDTAGNFLTDKENLPEICQCCMQGKSGDCILNTATVERPMEQRIFHCKFGVSAIQSPFIINGRVLGYLGCGYGRLSTNITQVEPISDKFAADSAQEAYFKLNFIHRNHLNSVAETLSLVSASLIQLMINSLKEKELSDYRINLSQEREKQALLHHSLSQARLKFLESQVNPHFLFNTLNTIAQQAEMDGASKLASLTYSLSNLLRLSLGKADSLVTIEEELSYIKDYLFIQQTRFPKKFTVTISIEPEILEIKIPFMTIMVLIENSILHGFKDVRREGKLVIRGYKEGPCGVIEVQDNGCGIPDNIVAAVRELPNHEYDPPSLKGIGIKNIFLRLKHYYGELFEFTISRSKTGGTLARIVLPL